jgi:hypothetical protein
MKEELRMDADWAGMLATIEHKEHSAAEPEHRTSNAERRTSKGPKGREY